MSAKAHRDRYCAGNIGFPGIAEVCSIPGPRKNLPGLLVDGVLKDRTVVIGRKFNDIDEF
jgi:hypothetical protein